MKTGLIGWFVAGLLAAPMTEATVITYNFTATGGHFGSFSYDNTNTTTVATPPGFFGPTSSWYDAISVTIDGAALASPVIGIYNDLAGAYDCVVAASAVLGWFINVTLCASPPTLFSSQALSEADNRQLSDFTFPVSNALFVGFDGFPILTLTSAALEPATLALLGLGLAGLGFSRR